MGLFQRVPDLGARSFDGSQALCGVGAPCPRRGGAAGPQLTGLRLAGGRPLPSREAVLCKGVAMALQQMVLTCLFFQISFKKYDKPLCLCHPPML